MSDPADLNNGFIWSNSLKKDTVKTVLTVDPADKVLHS